MKEREKLPYNERIAKEIIEALEKGTAPWTKPWKGESLHRMAPFNPTTGKAYEGINFVNLAMQTMTTGDPRWMTYKQAKTLGGQVRKGASGTTIQYWKLVEQIDKKDEQGNKIIGKDGKPVKQTIKLQNPKVFYATVFNGSQIDNLPTLQKDLDEKQKLTDFTPNEVAEKILTNSGANINHKDGNRAFYSPYRDEITLPHKEQFKSEAGYYATALHELGHWTGHESRLDRDMTHSFGSIGYAKEELRAEIGSYMLSSKLGVDFDPSNHNAYIDSWVQILEDAPTEIFKACSDASKIVHFVTDLQHEKVITNNQTAQVTKEAIDLGFSFTPVYLDKAEVLTDKTKWDNWDKDFKIEDILSNQSSSLVENPNIAEKQDILDDIQLYAEAMNDKSLFQKIYDIKKHDSVAQLKPLEEHFNRLLAINDENKPYKDFVSKETIANGINIADSHVQDTILKPYDIKESEAIDVIFDYKQENYPKDHEYLAEIVNEKYQTNFSEADIASIYNVHEEWIKERTPDNDPELLMSDIHQMEDKYMKEHKIPDKPFTASAERLLGKLVVDNMDIVKLNPTDAKELIEQYGSIQEQSPYGSTHTELDFGNAGKAILIQRDDNGDVYSSVALRENWDDNFFTNKEKNEQHGSKIIKDKKEMKALERNDLLLEVRGQLNNGLRGEDLTDYIKPIASNPTTPIEEISKTIDWTLSTIKARGAENEQISKTLNNLENILEEAYETRTNTKSSTLQEIDNDRKLKERDKVMDTKEKTDTFTEKTYLAVPFKEKDLAKKAGAKWDKEKKLWFAPVGANKEKLRDWRIENKEIKQLLGTPNTSQDPVSEFKEALEAQGLIIEDNPIMDGELRRVKVTGDKGNQKSGAYMGYSDGRPAGMIQNFKTGYKENWKSTNGEFSKGVSAKEIAEQKAIIEAKRAERTKEQEALHEKVSETVSEEFKEALEAQDNHPYLVIKGVKAHGLKVDKRNNLIMPIKDVTGKHWTSQRINSSFKGLVKDGKKEGNFHIIGADKISELKEIIIVEGFATGASIHEAVGTPVVVAVDSGNLKPVAEAIKEKYPDKPILFAGDNDIKRELEGKDNVGKLASAKASKDVKAFSVIPNFTNDEIKAGSSDFNDLAKSRGLKEVKRQIDIALTKAKTQAQATKQEQAKTQNLDQNKKNQREVVRKQNHGISL